MNLSTQIVSQLMQEVAAKGSCNMLGSPMSINVMLYIIAAGAKGATLAQLLQCLDANTLPDIHYRSSYLIALANLPPQGEGVVANFDNTSWVGYAPQVVGEGPKLCFVNGIWVDQSLRLNADYEHVVKVVYKAEAQSVDFRNRVSIYSSNY